MAETILSDSGKPLISVIIPTRNAGGDISNCLDSLQVQRFTDFDVHVVDAASTDGTLDLARHYSKKVGLGVRCWEEPKSDIYLAMNIGVSRSQGQWLYFLGADDLVHDPAVFEEVANCISTQEADFLYGDSIFKGSGRRHGGEFSLDRLLFECNICHQSIFYRRDVFARLGHFITRYPIWADWDMNIRCFRHPDIRTRWLDRTVAIYNDVSGASRQEDPVFGKELPVMLKQQCQRDMDALNANIEALKLTRSYRWGKALFGWLD